MGIDYAHPHRTYPLVCFVTDGKKKTLIEQHYYCADRDATSCTIR